MCVLLSCAVPTIISQPQQHRVLLDVRHSGHDFSDLSNFLDNLAREGYSIEKSSQQLSLAMLQQYSVVFIEGGFYGVPFSSKEIQDIVQYVEEGGGLLLNPQGWVWLFYGSKEYIADHSIENYPMNELSKEFGVVSNKDYFIDDVHKKQPLSSPDCFADHEVTRGIARLSYMNLVMSTLKVTDPRTVVVRGDADSYSSEANWKYRIYNPGDRPPLTTAITYGRGKVVVHIPARIWNGDDDKNGVEDMNEFDNLEFALNIFRWLTPFSETVTYTTTRIFSSTETHTSVRTETETVSVLFGQPSVTDTLLLVALVVLAPLAYVLGRRARKSVSVAEPSRAGPFEVSVNVPSAGKTVSIEAGPDHTVGSLVDTLMSTLNLPAGKAYAVEYTGKLISRPDFGKSLATFGINEGSKLSLRVVE